MDIIGIISIVASAVTDTGIVGLVAGIVMIVCATSTTILTGKKKIDAETISVVLNAIMEIIQTTEKYKASNGEKELTDSEKEIIVAQSVAKINKKK